MCIPYGFYQGNRSEYLAIPALCKLGFTVPVPRQEDHFGVDFIVHLARMTGQTVVPSGKSFGIQIKSDKAPLIFDNDKQHARDCLYGSTLPFFLGVVDRQNLTLTVYNTLNRLNFFWHDLERSESHFELTVDDESNGIPEPDFAKRTGGTGRSILEIDISDPATPRERLDEIEVLQSTMRSWIDLENENLSLKEQGIGLVFVPPTYTKNQPLGGDITPQEYPHIKFANPDRIPHVCRATEKALISLSFYLRKLREDGNSVPSDVDSQMEEMCRQVESLRRRCELFPVTYKTQCFVDPMNSTAISWTLPESLNRPQTEPGL